MGNPNLCVLVLCASSNTGNYSTVTVSVGVHAYSLLDGQEYNTSHPARERSGRSMATISRIFFGRSRAIGRCGSSVFLMVMHPTFTDRTPSSSCERPSQSPKTVSHAGGEGEESLTDAIAIRGMGGGRGGGK
eukprot:scaffold14723_cov32-Tisochrysis_lutea.AAC.3